MAGAPDRVAVDEVVPELEAVGVEGRGAAPAGFETLLALLPGTGVTALVEEAARSVPALPPRAALAELWVVPPALRFVAVGAGVAGLGDETVEVDVAPDLDSTLPAESSGVEPAVGGASRAAVASESAAWVPLR